jgi:hypothetical protein
MWRENLFSNLLVLFIIIALFVIIYCKIKDVTVMELIKEIREGFK